jgi:hypothetical protein
VDTALRRRGLRRRERASRGERGERRYEWVPTHRADVRAGDARVSGSDAAANTALANSVEIDMGSIATVIAIGGKTGDSANPPALLLCMDNQPSGGLLSDCSVAQ